MSAELTAKKSHVLEGYTSVTSDSDDDATEGTMKNRGALNWNESNTTKTVDAGYYSGGTLDSRPSYNKGIAEADGAEVDLPLHVQDRAREPTRRLGVGLQDVVGDALGGLGADARKPPQLVKQSLERPAVVGFRH